jgi:hypothetical protein
MADNKGKQQPAEDKPAKQPDREDPGSSSSSFEEGEGNNTEYRIPSK